MPWELDPRIDAFLAAANLSKYAPAIHREEFEMESLAMCGKDDLR